MKRLIYISILMALAAGLASCHRDVLPDVVGEVERTHDLPIQIVASIGDANIEGEEPSTRSVERAKKDFVYTDPENGTVGDVIHVQSEFLNKDKTQVIETRYTALQYVEEGKWEPMGNGRFAWPDDAEYGRFTAYYIHGSTGALTDYYNEDDSETATMQRFSDLVDGTDPLVSVTEELYGHTVTLKFEHMLTHLTIIELDAGIEDELVFTVDSKKAAEFNNAKFCNAFQIKLNSETNKIEIEYTTVYDRLNNQQTGGGQTGGGDEEIEGDGQTDTGDGDNGQTDTGGGDNGQTDTGSGDGQSTPSGYAALIKSQTVLVRDPLTRRESRQVGFFLEPGKIYDTFDILFSNHDYYIHYTNSSSQSKRGQELLANNRYTFNVKKSAGVTMATKPDQNWDESDDNFFVVVDAEAFLRAINTNSEYSEYDKDKKEWVQILEATTNPSGTLLKRNVKFANPYYHVFSYPDVKENEDGTTTEPYEFVPSVGGDNEFDGGYHYIDGMCCPLFYENSGVIKNLGLSNVTIGEDTYAKGDWKSDTQYNDDKTFKPYNYDSTGAIATRNNGTVQNIRIKNITINVEINENGQQESHYVGALLGENDGYVASIYLSGEIKINVNKSQGKEATINIGGLAGQNKGTIMDVDQLVDNRPEIKEGQIKPVQINITNSVTDSNGRYDIGGFVGNNGGKLNGINIPTTGDGCAAVTINSSQSNGSISYIGGIVGTAGSNEISSCLVGSGIVKAGSSVSFNDMIRANSYTGGIAGQISESVNVSNCTVFCSVVGAESSTETQYGTGGVFGKIIASSEKGEMTSIAAFGDTLSGTNVGCFAGEVLEDGNNTTDRDWENYYQERVDVKTFLNYPYIANPEQR